ncbi:MAG: ATP-binding protein [Thermodesulfobacteriota bacterium]|nr:ATP-binding protein [Thermodesulfobacteriota bacterium]
MNRFFKAFSTFMSGLSESERRRRKREGIIIIALPVVVGILTFIESRVIHFGTDIPISNTVLMFILININLLLLILLIFFVFRNLVKLFYDRKQNVMGASLRTRLVVAFISLTLVPAIVLFFFSINFITTSIKFWFNVPVEQALQHSLKVGKSMYDHLESSNRFFLKRAAYQITTNNLLRPYRENDLSRYIQIVQREFNLNAVEVYAPGTERLTYAISPELEKTDFDVIPSIDLMKKGKNDDTVVTITRNTPVGELVSSITSVPFGKTRDAADGILVISILLPPDLSSNLSYIGRGIEEYQEMKLMKEPIRITYYITLSVVALLVVFCSIWFGFYIANSITTPIMELGKGLERVSAGDLHYTIERLADDEIGMLVSSFNKMTDDLRAGRRQIEASAKILEQQRDEIEARRLYMETVLNNISTGVISLDADGTVTTVNKSAEKMLALVPENVLRRPYTDVLNEQHMTMAEDLIHRIKDKGEDTVEMPLRLTIKRRPRSFIIYLNALRHDKTGQYMGVVMVVDDLTELEKAQRMAAWREVARRIAHEVKNPLTPISLSAQRLKRKFGQFADDKVFDECIRTIIEYVDLIRNLVNEFSAFAKFPTAKLKPCELVPIIRETTDLFAEDDNRVRFFINEPEDLPLLNLDRQQIKQALINLIDNAISAMEGTGDITITATYDPVAMKVRIKFADTGKGLGETEKSNLFEPYFSTKKSGMGLGLAIVSSIIADHSGTITAHDNSPRGAMFIIELPV